MQCNAMLRPTDGQRSRIGCCRNLQTLTKSSLPSCQIEFCSILTGNRELFIVCNGSEMIIIINCWFSSVKKENAT